MRVAFILAAALATTAISPAAMAFENEAKDKEKVICKSVTATGTRLSRERICRTKAEWDRHYEEGRKAGSDIIDAPKVGPKG